MTTLLASGAAASRRRIWGIILRDFYAFRGNTPRWIETIFWPTLELIIWGSVSLYLQANAMSMAVSALLGATLLWQVLYRSQGELSLAFLDDIWSRNLINLFVTPVTVREYLAGLVLFGSFKMAVSAATMGGLALLLFGFGLFSMGPALVPYMVVLIVMGWALGVFAIAVVLRFGASAQVLAWILSFVFQPFSAVFYPLSVLPQALQTASRAVPASYVFESMRTVLAGGAFDWAALVTAAVLDVVYVALALGFLAYALRHARHRGKLSRFGD
ncbi:ABC transporter permease [Catellatospora tritici]|uniref:ABC transporter permease n=1 Tax=Catellatospora tritici TaxID=2851566 RepID=UPI001C2D5E9F|nr:ABC transporter permease [Catellatospora tritici]MBV1850447.1 ABC transporter permease [Catellatospora tritici]